MPLILEDPLKTEIKWWADSDDRGSDYDSSVYFSSGNDAVEGKAILNIHGGSVKDVLKWDVGAATVGTRLVSPRLRIFLAEITGEQLNFLPTLCRCRDGEVIGYSFAVPRRHVSCVDLSRTEVTDWFVPGETIIRYRSIALKEDCTEPMGIYRDMHFRHFTVVGEELARKLSDTGFKGLRFVGVEDARNPFGKG